MCIHGRRKSQCKVCGGSEICAHGRRKTRCRECKGSEICAHDRRKSQCKDCGGSEICVHGRRKAQCLECVGSEICIHSRRKGRCKECEGSQICAHNRQKAQCQECGGSQICYHGRHKSICLKCGGSQICAHGRRKSQCIECEGSQICTHSIRKLQCRICDPPIHPQNWCQSCQYVLLNKPSLYKPYCFDCYCVLNPDAVIPRQRKLKEHHMRDAIIEKFPEFQIVWDQKIDNGCSRRRPDGRLECFTHSIIIECDENQHRNYSCEENRINDIYMDLGCRPLVVIRFNPDAYTENGKAIPSCFSKLKTVDNSINKPEWNRRITILLKTLEYHHKNIPQNEITEVELFYSNEQPKIKVV